METTGYIAGECRDRLAEDGLVACLDWLQKTFDVYVHVKDLVGFSRLDVCRIDANAWGGHNCDFCLLAKSTTTGLRHCVNDKYEAHLALEQRRRPCFRHCYLGLGELLVPIVAGPKLIGSIACGHFSCFESADERVQSLTNWADRLGIDAHDLCHEHEKSAKSDIQRLETVLPPLSLLAANIANAYSDARPRKEAVQLSGVPCLLPGSHGDWLVEEAISYMKAHYDKDIAVDDLAKHVGRSANYFGRVFKRKLGMSSREYLNRLRIAAAKELLTHSDLRISDVAFQTGFNDSNYFSTVFSEIAGTNPRTYRRHSKGQASTDS